MQPKIIFAIITYHPNPTQLKKLLAVLKPYKTLIIDNTKHNLGYAGGANKAIKQGLKQDCDWIVILNQDLVITTSFLQKFVLLLKISRPGILGPFAGSFDQNRWTTILDKNSKLETRNSKQILMSEIQNFGFRISDFGFNGYISGSFLAIHKKVIEKIGDFYQPYFMYYEDADFCVRAQKAGFSIATIKIPGISHHDAAPSFLHEYYLARNHLLFVARNTPLSVKIYELLRFPKTIYEHLKNKNTGALRGILDFFLNKFGGFP